MPADAPELHEKRDGQPQIIKRINWLLRHQGGSAGATLLVVDGIATGSIQLSSFNSGNYSDASICYVRSVGDYFAMRSTSTTADGITRVDCFGKSGYQWERIGIPNLNWQAQLNWSVSSAGSDEATGVDDSHALKTMSELARRVSGAIYTGTVPCIVRVLTSVTDDAFFNVTYLGTGPTASPRSTPRGLDSYFTIVGVPTIIYSGTISAPTTAAKGSTDICTFTDAGIPVSFTASGYLATDLIYKRTNGTVCYFWPYKDLGAKAIQISQPQVALTTCPTLSAGDSYSILQLPHVGALRFPEPSDATGVQLSLVRHVGAAIVRGTQNIRYSATSGASGACGQIVNCRDFSFSTIANPPAFVVTSGLISVGSSGNKLIIGSNTQGRLSSEGADFVTFGGITFVGDHDDTVAVIQAMFYDCTTPCLEVPQEDTRFNLNTSGIGGANNTDDILNVSAASSWITYITVPPAGMTSKGSPCTNNGVSVAVGSLPNNDVSVNAFICAT